MLDKRIDMLVEQTSYLIEKQEEMHKQFEQAYDKILSKISEKSELIGQQDLPDVKAIKEIIATHKKKTDKEFEQDIEFLKEQLEAINKIKKIDDKKRAEELLNMIVPEDEELSDTQDFKQQVNVEILSAKKELDTMQDDIVSALQEGNFNELKLMLEALGDNEEASNDLENQSCCSSGCSSCPSSSQCSGGKDIFSAFEGLENKDEE